MLKAAAALDVFLDYTYIDIGTLNYNGLDKSSYEQYETQATSSTVVSEIVIIG